VAASHHGDTPYSGNSVTSVPVTPYTTSADVNRVILTEITLERQEDGPLLQLARLALIVAESGRCGGPMGVAERHTCLVLRLARACSEVWPVAADRMGIWMTGSGRSRGRCTRRLTRTGSTPTRCVTWRGHLGLPAGSRRG